MCVLNFGSLVCEAMISHWLEDHRIAIFVRPLSFIARDLGRLVNVGHFTA
jgi:hypothetical protein